LVLSVRAFIGVGGADDPSCTVLPARLAG